MTDSLSVLDYLEANVPDYRRRQGRRYPLSKLLVMITMAIMSGHYAYREIARFLKANQREIIDSLRLPRRGVPSHVTIRSVLQQVDFSAVREAFETWTAQHRGAASGAWIAIDAKAIGSTVSDYDTAYQDFACVVSAFSRRCGVLAGEPYSNKAESEVAATRRLIERLTQSLGLPADGAPAEGKACFTFDALHAKKRPSNSSSTVDATTS